MKINIYRGLKEGRDAFISDEIVKSISIDEKKYASTTYYTWINNNDVVGARLEIIENIKKEKLLLSAIKVQKQRMDTNATLDGEVDIE